MEYISPLKCKRALGVPLGDKHAENKKLMLAYVKENGEHLIAGATVTTHDSADSIAILNTYLREKKRKINDDNVYENAMPELRLICPDCKHRSGRIYMCTSSQNSGRYFVTCTANDCRFEWLDFIPEPVTDEETGKVHIGPWIVGIRRPPLECHPNKKQKLLE